MNIESNSPLSEAPRDEMLSRFPNKVFFIDLNDTCTRTNNHDQPTDEDIKALRDAVGFATSKGWSVMVNSDSPHKPLIDATTRWFGFAPSGLAENGCLLVNGTTGDTLVRAAVPHLDQLKSHLTLQLAGKEAAGGKLLKLQDDIWSPEWGIPNTLTVVDGDNKRTAQAGDLVYGFGVGRIATASIFGFQVQEGEGGPLLVPNPDVTNLIDSSLTTLFTADNVRGACHYSYPGDGFTAVHPGENKADVRLNKARGGALLLNGYPDRTIVFIGDDYRDGKPRADLLTAEKVGRAFSGAVGNAQDTLKNEADYIAKNDYGVGAAEVIRHFVQELG